jgi:hypothetical protein
MTWKGVPPVVPLVTATYEKGVRLTRAAMATIEAKVQRLPGLGPWFLDISCAPTNNAVAPGPNG